MAKYYITQGPVRGQCPHHHRTLSGAVRCLEHDAQGCGQHGGYTDRSIYRVDGAGTMPLTDEERDEVAERQH